MWSFRHAATRNARAALMTAQLTAPPSSTGRDMLFILRRGARRVITNEDEVVRRLMAEQPRLQAIAFETLPIASQMLVVASASTLIGVHGAGIAAYTSFLPADERKPAVVEIRPDPHELSKEWIWLVKDLAAAAGAAFFFMWARRAPGCAANAFHKRWLECKTLGTPRAIDSCTKKAVRSAPGFANRSVLWCNVTIQNIWTLSRLVREAASRTAVRL